MAAPLVKVVNQRFVGGCRYTGYVDKAIRLFLACGHEQQRKASQGVPKRARCVECERENHKTPNVLADRREPIGEASNERSECGRAEG